MSYRFVKRQNAIGWDWYLESDDCSSWVSQLVKEVIETLETENAKLREERDHWHVEQVHAYGNWEDAHKRAAELQAENTKLRELAAILCHCMQIKASCDDCRISGHKGELARDPLCACDGLHEMLRDLGVDVNG